MTSPVQDPTPSPRDTFAVSVGAAMLAALVILPLAFGAKPAADHATFPQYALKFLRLLDSDVVQRDALATTSSAQFRKLDRLAAPDAKIYASGVGGPENGQRLGNLFWAIYYFFPRQLEVSLSRTSVFTAGGWLEGVDSPSDEELLARGYDIRLSFEVGKPEDQQMLFTPLNDQRAFRPNR